VAVLGGWALVGARRGTTIISVPAASVTVDGLLCGKRAWGTLSQAWDYPRDGVLLNAYGAFPCHAPHKTGGKTLVKALPIAILPPEYNGNTRKYEKIPA